MFTDPILQRNEVAIEKLKNDVQKLKADIQRLTHDGAEAREQASRVLQRIQADQEKDVALIDRKRQVLEREVLRLEQENDRRRKELEKADTKIRR
jgi:chromosome segregation ATPase